MIEVQVKSEDKLSCETWSFWLDDRTFKLNLNGYKFEKRRTTRHKYRIESYYKYHIRGIPEMSTDTVSLPDEVKKAAIHQVIDKLEVCK